MEFIHEEGRIYAKDAEGLVAAEVAFSPSGPDEVTIDSTYVAPSLRGGGAAGELLKALCERLRREGRRAVAVCPYAARWFERNEAYRDILK